nr:lactate racemase domain-containing protein [Candidatus Sigynarchaeota archaeon]
MALNLRVNIPFGSKNLDIEIPLNCKIEAMAPLTSTIAREKGSENAESEAVHKELLSTLAPFTKRMQEASKIIIACDDNTRVTPVQRLLPSILGKIKETGKDVSIIVAGGSHRHVTKQEKVAKFGASIVDAVPILDHEWDRSDALVNFGRSAGGYDLKLNKHACEPGTFLIGVGNIVPHRVCGFSGGYKILLPGLTCPDTMNSIHYMSARYKSEEILGITKNPVRDAINEIAKHRPIDFLINTVLDGNSKISSLCLGDPVTSQYQGAEIAKQIYGVKVNVPADVVITDAVPENIDFWVCAKALTNTKSFVRRGG